MANIEVEVKLREVINVDIISCIMPSGMGGLIEIPSIHFYGFSLLKTSTSSPSEKKIWWNYVWGGIVAERSEHFVASSVFNMKANDKKTKQWIWDWWS